MNILVIFTGGTIGSQTDQQVIKPDKDTGYYLIDDYRLKSLDQETRFSTITPFQRLSETITPQDWTTLIETIQDIDFEAYDGIIITHGTDTLALTAKALYYTLSTLTLPVVMVSSHLPPRHPESNAYINFKKAVETIKEKKQGLWVAYQNPDHKDVKLFDAQTITQSPQLSSHFEAVDEKFKEPKQLIYKPIFESKLLYIRPHPALNYAHFNLDQVNVIVHDLYHSGTCDETKALAFLARCNERNIPIYFAPLASQSSYYETTHRLQEAGARFIYDLSIESVLVKVMLIEGNKNAI